MNEAMTVDACGVLTEANALKFQNLLPGSIELV